jgi:hypothetical protein
MNDRVYASDTLENLVVARVLVEPRHLEELLEALAGLEFPVNPELQHRTGAVIVEFPAYAEHVEEIRNTIRRLGFDAHSLDVFGVLHAAAGGLG